MGLLNPAYNQVIPTAAPEGGAFYSHPAFKGLALVKVPSLSACRHLGGALVELGGFSEEPTANAARKYAVGGFVGRDIRFLESGAQYMGFDMPRPISTPAPSDLIDLGLASHTTHSGVIGGPGSADTFVKMSQVMAGTSQTDVMSGQESAVAGGKVMGVIAEAEFGFLCDSVVGVRNAFSSAYADRTAFLAAYPNYLCGYLGKNVSLGRIADVLEREKDAIFDVPSDLRGYRDQAIREYRAAHPSREFLIPVGIGFKATGDAVFGILTIRPKKLPLANNNGWTRSTTVQEPSNVSVNGLPTRVVTYGAGMGGYAVPWEFAPHSHVGLEVIPLTYTPAWGDVRGKMLLLETLPPSRQLSAPLQAPPAWEGGLSVADAVKEMLTAPHPEASAALAAATDRAAIGNVVGNRPPSFSSDQAYGHTQMLVQNGRFAGTLSQLMHAVTFVYDRMHDLAK